MLIPLAVENDQNASKHVRKFCCLTNQVLIVSWYDDDNDGAKKSFPYLSQLYFPIKVHLPTKLASLTTPILLE